MNGWELAYDGFDPEHEALREALCTLGNGCLATRGAAEETGADGVHYPGTYLAGGYNRLDTAVAGRTVTNEDLVNFPNWLPLSFRADDGDWMHPETGDYLDYRQTLDLQEGILRRRFRFRDRNGRETRVETRRFVHMDNPHLAGIEWRLTPLNWNGALVVRSMLDGSVINDGVARYRELNSRHLEVLAQGGIGEDQVFLLAQTTQSQLRMAQVARTRLFQAKRLLEPTSHTRQEAARIAGEYRVSASTGTTIRVEKIVTIYTSRDRAISECAHDARTAMGRTGSFSELARSHKRAWKYLWLRSDVRVRNRLDEQLALRLHIFHLLQSVSRNSIDFDVGVPARGLHGEAYRGHIFWDELFIFPFYTFRMPEITRTLLFYRYRRLDMARCIAREAGYQGAMYPWQSGSNGREETQILHLNPRSGRWEPDFSRHQRHVNSAIVYNVWQYYLATGDIVFLAMHGAEMILEIARFWASIAHYNKRSLRYEIHGVMGPDEYHETYPGSRKPGLRNNAYTNVMAVWVLERAMEILGMLRKHRSSELREKLGITDRELKRWQNITRKMTVPFLDDGIISQFEGYEKLQELNWGKYLEKYGNIERLDRIIKAEGDSPDRYKVSKQADVLMLFYLFPPKELRRMFEQLGYPFPDDTVSKTTEYYLRRTSHGSSLSKVVLASVLDRIDRTAAWNLFCESLESDLSDVQGGTTQEGIHLGAMAGTVDIVFRHYAGIDIYDGILSFFPRLPEPLKQLRLRLQFRGQWFQIEISHSEFRLKADADAQGPLDVEVCGEPCRMEPGSERVFALNSAPGTQH